jgi:hypothetical protein
VARATAAKAAAAGHALHPTAAQVAAYQKTITDHSLAVGFSRGFEVSAGVMVLALVVTLLVIRVTKKDLEGIQPSMVG